MSSSDVSAAADGWQVYGKEKDMGELAERQEHQVAERQSVTPDRMLQIAIEKGADMAQLEKLMDLQQRWEANEARKAFVAALNAFKADPPRLVKNKHVDFTTSKGRTQYDHATLDHVSEEIGRSLARHGLSHRWDVDQSDPSCIRVTCVLTHDQGHSERVPMAAPADQSGGKNSIQAIGSTVTYLQRYTLLSATGMAVKGQDDDGHAGGAAPPAETISDEKASQIVDLLEATGTPESTLLRFAFAGRMPPDAGVHDIPASMADRCIRKLTATLKKQRGEA